METLATLLCRGHVKWKHVHASTTNKKHVKWIFCVVKKVVPLFAHFLAKLTFAMLVGEFLCEPN